MSCRCSNDWECSRLHGCRKYNLYFSNAHARENEKISPKVRTCIEESVSISKTYHVSVYLALPNFPTTITETFNFLVLLLQPYIALDRLPNTSYCELMWSALTLTIILKLEILILSCFMHPSTKNKKYFTPNNKAPKYPK